MEVFKGLNNLLLATKFFLLLLFVITGWTNFKQI
jgi:hypothetical protein